MNAPGQNTEVLHYDSGRRSAGPPCSANRPKRIGTAETPSSTPMRSDTSRSPEPIFCAKRFIPREPPGGTQRSFREARVYFLSKCVIDPLALRSQLIHPDLARLDPSYGGPFILGTETVTAHPGDRTVVNPTYQNTLDAFSHGRASGISAHGRYLQCSTGARGPMVWTTGYLCTGSGRIPANQSTDSDQTAQ